MLMIIDFAVTSFTWGPWVWKRTYTFNLFKAYLDSSYAIVYIVYKCIYKNKERLVTIVHYCSSHNFT